MTDIRVRVKTSAIARSTAAMGRAITANPSGSVCSGREGCPWRQRIMTRPRVNEQAAADAAIDVTPLDGTALQKTGAAQSCGACLFRLWNGYRSATLTCSSLAGWCLGAQLGRPLGPCPSLSDRLDLCLAKFPGMRRQRYEMHPIEEPFLGLRGFDSPEEKVP
jgi:hypothetical protein